MSSLPELTAKKKNRKYFQLSCSGTTQSAQLQRKPGKSNTNKCKHNGLLCMRLYHFWCHLFQTSNAHLIYCWNLFSIVSDFRPFSLKLRPVNNAEYIGQSWGWMKPQKECKRWTFKRKAVIKTHCDWYFDCMMLSSRVAQGWTKLTVSGTIRQVSMTTSGPRCCSAFMYSYQSEMMVTRSDSTSFTLGI